MGLAKPRNLMRVRWISAILNLRHRMGVFNLMWRGRNMPSTTYSALNAGDLGQRQPSNGLPGVGYFPPEGKCKMSLRVCGLLQLTLMGLALHRRDVQYIEDIDLEQEYNI